MSGIYVNIGRIGEGSDSLQRIRTRISDVQHRIERLARKKLACDRNGVLKKQIRNTADAVDSIGKHINALGTVLTNAKTLYEQCEERIQGKQSRQGSTVKEKSKSVIESIEKIWQTVLIPLNPGYMATLAGDLIKRTQPYRYIQTLVGEGGKLHKEWQYVKASYRVVKGLATVALSIGAVVGSAGASTPVSLVGMIYGFNDVTSGIMDLINVRYDQYDETGKADWLQDTLIDNGGEITDLLFDNREVGEKGGQVLYGLGKEINNLYEIESGILDKSAAITTTSVSEVNINNTVRDIWNNADVGEIDGMKILKSVNPDPASWGEDILKNAINSTLGTKIENYSKYFEPTASTLFKFGDIASRGGKTLKNLGELYYDVALD